MPAIRTLPQARLYRSRWYLLARFPWMLLPVLAVQSALSMRLLRADTAFRDEALYLWAGHVEWEHWLHGLPTPAFATYFSGAPVIYPPLGALADSLGGLAMARGLSLLFMLGATCFLWSAATRLFGRRAAFFSAAIWAFLGPTVHLGALATYDAMALFFVAFAAWCATARRNHQDATGWMILGAAALALANTAKYASALFDPSVIALAVLSACPAPGGKAALRRGAFMLACLTGALAALLRIGGPAYVTGIATTTTLRRAVNTPVKIIISQSWDWIGIVVILSALAVLLSLRSARRQPWTPALLSLLAVSALLAPVGQARIHTATSLSKHADFGAWLAAIAGGHAVNWLASLPRRPCLRVIALAAAAACLIPLSRAGLGQARSMTNAQRPHPVQVPRRPDARRTAR